MVLLLELTFYDDQVKQMKVLVEFVPSMLVLLLPSMLCHGYFDTPDDAVKDRAPDDMVSVGVKVVALSSVVVVVVVAAAVHEMLGTCSVWVVGMTFVGWRMHVRKDYLTFVRQQTSSPLGWSNMLLAFD